MLVLVALSQTAWDTEKQDVAVNFVGMAHVLDVQIHVLHQTVCCCLRKENPALVRVAILEHNSLIIIGYLDAELIRAVTQSVHV